MEIGKKSLKKTLEIKNLSGKMDMVIDNFGKWNFEAINCYSL